MKRILSALLITLLSITLINVPAALAQNPAVTINIDAAAGRRPISPNIYGVAHSDSASLADLNSPLNRSGGNNTSRYNWQINSDNRGADWYFQSIAYPSATAGELGDTFIQNSRASGAEPMLTIPMVGWVAKLGANRNKLSSFSIAKYGAQTGNDWQWFPDAGNGIWTSGQEVVGNDPNDASVPANSLFQQGWVQHLVTRWGMASGAGLRYYILDNEPSIWHATHRDVHPTGATMDEIRDKTIDYAGRIKAIDPSALVVGPEEWGWSGYLFSGYDQQYGSRFGWSNLPDRANHGGADVLPWLLDQFRQHDTATGQRLLDVFSVHYYPQGGEFGNDTSSSMQLRRNRSTRSLWDPNYVDETWINDKVKLVPRLKGWVNSFYPGTKTALTEYNWGAEGHINGATAQADIFGILGREGLDIATRWTTPAVGTPVYKAIKMYRNYDGNKSTFGDTSVQTAVPNPDNLSAFGAVRSSDGALTVMVVNKVLSNSTPTTINVANFAHGPSAQVWQLTSANTIARLADATFSGNGLTASLPQQSITLFVIPAAASNRAPTAVASASPTSGAVPLIVSFDGRASSDPDGTISTFAWAFGDGTAGTGSLVNHTYTTTGTFVATLTVTDNSGATSWATREILVNPAPPTVVNAPSNLAGSVSGATIVLTWTDNSNNEDGFYVERALKGASNGFARIGQTGVGVATFSESLSPGVYLYRVRAFRGTAVSASSSKIQLRVR